MSQLAAVINTTLIVCNFSKCLRLQNIPWPIGYDRLVTLVLLGHCCCHTNGFIVIALLDQTTPYKVKLHFPF